MLNSDDVKRLSFEIDWPSNCALTFVPAPKGWVLVTASVRRGSNHARIDKLIDPTTPEAVRDQLADIPGRLGKAFNTDPTPDMGNYPPPRAL
jgi:hypothetical protein